jgi:hypothetical protein
MALLLSTGAFKSKVPKNIEERKSDFCLHKLPEKNKNENEKVTVPNWTGGVS